jgi:hypothetical protein
MREEEERYVAAIRKFDKPLPEDPRVELTASEPESRPPGWLRLSLPLIIPWLLAGTLMLWWLPW